MVDQKILSRTVLAAAAMATLAGAGQAYAMVVAAETSNRIPVEAVSQSLGANSGATKAVIDAPMLSLALGTSYVNNDTLTFTLSGTGCEFKGSQYYLAWNDAATGGTADYAVVNGGSSSPITQTNAGSTVLTFRVTDDTATNTGSTLDLTDNGTTYWLTDETDPDSSVTGTFNAGAGPDIVISGLTTEGNKCTVSVAAATSSGSTIDSNGTTSADIIVAYEQFDSKVATKLDATIDVDADRLKFVSAGTTDVLTVTLHSDPTLMMADEVILANVDDKWGVTLFADDLDGIKSISDGSACTAFTIDTTADTATCTYGGDQLNTMNGATFGGVTADTVTIGLTFTIDQTTTMDSRDFTMDVQMVLNDEKYSDYTTDDADSGRWKLNGMQAKVPYFLIGNDYAWNFLKVTNETDDDADITVDATIQNLTSDTAETSVVAAALVDENGATITATSNSVTSVSTEDLTQTLGLGSDSYLASLTLTVNGPADSIHVTGHLFTSTGREALPVLYPTSGSDDRGWRQ